MSDDRPRLIEKAFPLKQASLDSVHEKNVRHGHISTLHIWPARRPLAACRAALIATLLPDPGSPEERQKLCEKIGGRVVKVVKKKKLPSGKVEEKVVEETVGGILHWGRESDPAIEWFRQEIKKAYGGRAPKVLDPFAGGGSIPLEAMRLGCEATAIDINPVAWFILKCTLEYPQKLAGQHRPLPDFALKSREFMAGFFKNTERLTKRQLERNLDAVQQHLFPPPDVDLAWHVRAWAWWVLQRAKADLERFYPVVDGKSTVAYFWARTVTCKNCRATIPLLKMRWLCKKDRKRVLLTMEPNADRTGVVFGIETNVPTKGGNAAQRREHDKRIGAGTMSRAGATCPCCGTIMTMQDIRLEGRAGRLGTTMTAVVVGGPEGKEYRLPTAHEVEVAAQAEQELDRVFADIPFGIPNEPLPDKEALGMRVPLYGFDKWSKLFTPRQLVALGTVVKWMRAAKEEIAKQGYEPIWAEAVTAYLACGFDRMLDFNSTCLSWITSVEAIRNTFSRYALPISWDFNEAVLSNYVRGSWEMSLEACMESYDTIAKTMSASPPAPEVRKQSALGIEDAGQFDLVVTDPPYYDAIPYSDLMDYFYVWLRRSTSGLAPGMADSFREPLSPKWENENRDGELIDDDSRHSGDRSRSKAAYEDGMSRVFQVCCRSLRPDGRLVIVFAHKHPDAWETLVSAIIRSGFVVDGSWPIQTEQVARVRAQASAALASSVWLVCKKRPESARPGWDAKVLEEMREKIGTQLREFWDAGIRGPDFVWAATGPAMAAYSKHPVVKKANEPGQVMTVSEFLQHVRRIVVDFVVGRVLSGNGGGEAVSGLDDVTTYYLLHRHDFGVKDSPIGPCILYAVSCGLSDSALADQYDILLRTGGQASPEEDEDETEAADESGEAVEGTGSTVRLKAWQQRSRPGMGYDPAVDSPRARREAAMPMLPGMDVPVLTPAPRAPREIPLIDQVHRLMHLWKAGDVVKVDDYLDMRALRRNALFHQLLQALIELAPGGSEERALLESISNHVAARGVAKRKDQEMFTTDDTEGTDAEA